MDKGAFADRAVGGDGDLERGIGLFNVGGVGGTIFDHVDERAQLFVHRLVFALHVDDLGGTR